MNYVTYQLFIFISLAVFQRKEKKEKKRKSGVVGIVVVVIVAVFVDVVVVTNFNLAITLKVLKQIS